MNLDEDKVHQLQQSIIKNIKESNFHTKPSPETKKWHKDNIKWHKKMSNDNEKLKINMARYEEKVDNISRNVDDIYNIIDKFIETADRKYVFKSEQKILNDSVNSLMQIYNNKFASKLTQKIVYGAVATVLAAFMGYLISLSFKKF